MTSARTGAFPTVVVADAPPLRSRLRRQAPRNRGACRSGDEPGTGHPADMHEAIGAEGDIAGDDLLAVLRAQITRWTDECTAYRAAEKAARDARWAEPVERVTLEDICGGQD